MFDLSRIDRVKIGVLGDLDGTYAKIKILDGELVIAVKHTVVFTLEKCDFRRAFYFHKGVSKGELIREIKVYTLGKFAREKGFPVKLGYLLKVAVFLLGELAVGDNYERGGKHGYDRYEENDRYKLGMLFHNRTSLKDIVEEGREAVIDHIRNANDKQHRRTEGDESFYRGETAFGFRKKCFR
jgi:hypothetical protein